MSKTRDVVIVHGIDGSAVMKRQIAPIKSDGIRALFDSLDAQFDGRFAGRWLNYIADSALALKDLTKEERKLLRNSKRAMRACLTVLDSLDMRDRLIIARALDAMAIVARYADPGDTHFERQAKHYEGQRAEFIRDLKAKKREPKKRALEDAIKSVRGDSACEKPWKESEAIRNEVNIYLVERGFKPVSADTIARQIQKLPPQT